MNLLRNHEIDEGLRALLVVGSLDHSGVLDLPHARRLDHAGVLRERRRRGVGQNERIVAFALSSRKIDVVGVRPVGCDVDAARRHTAQIPLRILALRRSHARKVGEAGGRSVRIDDREELGVLGLREIVHARRLFDAFLFEPFVVHVDAHVAAVDGRQPFDPLDLILLGRLRQSRRGVVDEQPFAGGNRCRVAVDPVYGVVLRRFLRQNQLIGDAGVARGRGDELVSRFRLKLLDEFLGKVERVVREHGDCFRVPAAFRIGRFARASCHRERRDEAGDGAKSVACHCFLHFRRARRLRRGELDFLRRC